MTASVPVAPVPAWGARMHRLVPTVISSLFALAAASMAAAAEFPDRLLVSGALGPDYRDAGGGVDEIANMIVTLENEDGSFVVYREVHCGVVTVGRDGRFELVVGSASPLTNPLDALFDEKYWLQVVACYEPDGCSAP